MTEQVQLPKRVRAAEINADYAVVVGVGSHPDFQGVSTPVYAFSVADRSTVLDRRFDGSGRATLDGTTLIVGGSQQIVINLRTGEANTRFEFGSRTEQTFSTYQIAALDPGRTRSLWIREVTSYTTFEQVGDTILVSAIPPHGD